MRTRNPVNGSHGHWAAIAAERKQQRIWVAWRWREAGMPRQLEPGQVVCLTRLSPGTLDDDNLRPALKSVRDQVAAELGIDDKLPVWRYAQEKAPRHAVRIELITEGST